MSRCGERLVERKEKGCPVDGPFFILQPVRRSEFKEYPPEILRPAPRRGINPGRNPEAINLFLKFDISSVRSPFLSSPCRRLFFR